MKNIKLSTHLKIIGCLFSLSCVPLIAFPNLEGAVDPSVKNPCPNNLKLNNVHGLSPFSGKMADLNLSLGSSELACAAENQGVSLKNACVILQMTLAKDGNGGYCLSLSAENNGKKVDYFPAGGESTSGGIVTADGLKAEIRYRAIGQILTFKAAQNGIYYLQNIGKIGVGGFESVTQILYSLFPVSSGISNVLSGAITYGFTENGELEILTKDNKGVEIRKEILRTLSEGGYGLRTTYTDASGAIIVDNHFNVPSGTGFKNVELTNGAIAGGFSVSSKNCSKSCTVTPLTKIGILSKARFNIGLANGNGSITDALKLSSSFGFNPDGYLISQAAGDRSVEVNMGSNGLPQKIISTSGTKAKTTSVTEFKNYVSGIPLEVVNNTVYPNGKIFTTSEQNEVVDGTLKGTSSFVNNIKVSQTSISYGERNGMQFAVSGKSTDFSSAKEKTTLWTATATEMQTTDPDGNVSVAKFNANGTIGQLNSETGPYSKFSTKFEHLSNGGIRVINDSSVLGFSESSEATVNTQVLNSSISGKGDGGTYSSTTTFDPGTETVSTSVSSNLASGDSLTGNSTSTPTTASSTSSAIVGNTQISKGSSSSLSSTGVEKATTTGSVNGVKTGSGSSEVYW